MAAAGVDGLRKLRFPVPVVAYIAEQLRGHGLALTPATEGEAA